MKKVLKSLRDPLKLSLLITYRFGNLVYYKCKLPVVRQLLMLIYYVLDVIFVRGLSNAYFPARARIGKGLRLPHGGNGIVIHPKTVIGDFATIFHQVTIGCNDSPTKCEGPPVLKNNIVLGAGAKILGDIVLADGSVVGANAVLLKSTGENEVWVGLPARKVEKKPNATSPAKIIGL